MRVVRERGAIMGDHRDARDVTGRGVGEIIETTQGPHTGLWLALDDSGYLPGCSRERVRTAVRIPGPVRSLWEKHHWGLWS